MTSGYLARTFKDLPGVVVEVANAIKKSQIEFDAIVLRGVSGLLVGVPVSLVLQKPLIIVRKADERSHASTLVEFDSNIINDSISSIENKKCLNYIVIDDLISTGNTINTIQNTINKQWFDKMIVSESMPQLKMIFLYARERYLAPETLRTGTQNIVKAPIFYTDCD